MEKNERALLKSLEGVRCLAFLGVFCFHTRLNAFRTLGAWGVSVFLVLTGFLMTYNYYKAERIKVITIKNNMIFAIQKMKKLYPLYLVTSLALFIFLVTGSERLSTVGAVFRIVINTFLVQAYFPIEHKSINTVAWFLCTIFLFYIIFPYILKKWKQNGRSK